MYGTLSLSRVRVAPSRRRRPNAENVRSFQSEIDFADYFASRSGTWEANEPERSALGSPREPAGRKGGILLTKRGLATRDFAVVVLLTGLVGAMVGSERNALPLMASRDFGGGSELTALSFLVAFGLTKAFANLAAGAAANRVGLRALLVAGWFAGLLVPGLLVATHSLSGLVIANVFLGANQGLCWSATVLLAMHAASPDRRGTAMGLNECGGYLAMALAAYVVGSLGRVVGDLSAIAIVGAVACAGGLALSFVATSSLPPRSRTTVSLARADIVLALRQGFSRRRLFVLNQAGLANNLKDGAAWGIFPLFYKWTGFSRAQATLLIALYPSIWGVSQLATGAFSDRWGRVRVATIGLASQVVALATMALAGSHFSFALAAGCAALLGVGTGMVHPTLMAAVGDAVPIEARAATLGVYRMWRDSGYAFGAILAGALVDRWGVGGALFGVAFLLSVSLVGLRFGSKT